MPTKKYLHNIDLAQNQLISSVLENRTSNPSTAVDGQIYYNTTSKSILVYKSSTGLWSEVGPQFVETDPIFTASASFGITSTNISNWNTAFGWGNHAVAGYQLTSQKGIANGYASLDGGGKVPVSQLPSSIMEYKGTWNASTNSPTLANGTGDTGDVYRVSVAGTQNLGAGNITFDIGDYVIYNGTVWEKSDTTDAVASVNGLTGVVVLSTSNISEGTSLYYTDARARGAISLTTTGTSGAATYNSSTGVLNIPQYQAVLTNPVTGTGTSGQIAYFNGTTTLTSKSTFVWDATNDRLGIGITPQYKLDISGSDALNGSMRLMTASSNNRLEIWTTNANAASRNWAVLANSVAFGDFAIRQSDAKDGQPSTGTVRLYFSAAGNVLLGSTADVTSSLFTLASTTKGFLPPRMTSAERTAIGSPAVGLVVYQTDGTEGLYENTSGGWRILFQTATGNGTVTSVSVVTANGISGTVATASTTPAITLTLGAITPTSVNSVVISGSSTPTLAVTGTSSISGSNTGDNAVNSLYSGLVSNATHTGDATGATALTVVGLRGVALPTLGASAGFLRYTGTGTNTWVFDTATYLTANQSITLSGDISGTGTTAITTTIGANRVTNAMLAQIPTATFHGRVTAATGNVENITGTQATTLLDVFSATLKGLAPASGGGTTNFLRADGTWTTPGGGGTVTSVSVVTANGISGTVATASTTPAITISLGAITPTSVNSVVISGSATPTLAVTGTSSISGSNTGDNAVNSLYSGLVSNATHTGDATGATALTVVGLRGVALPTLGASAGFLRYTGTGTNTWVFDTATYLTANQTITLSGAVTGSGTTAITTTLANSVVGIANLSATGTPSSTTYLRGDNTWATIAGGGITTLNTLTDISQTFATGTTGTDFNISSASGVHTFNIPSASATARGLVSTAAQTFAGLKSFSNGLNATGTANEFSAGTPSITTTLAGVSQATFGRLIATAINTTLGANFSYSSFLLVGNTVAESSAGTHNLFAQFSIKPLIVNDGAGSTTNAATLYIEGAASGTATITNNYAVWIDDGVVRIDDKLLIGTGVVNGTSTLQVTGQMRLNSYTTTTSFTGTAAGYLAFDASGNIITVAAPTGGGITTLNTLTGATQTFATGTAGTDFTITSTGTTHTFDIPSASQTARGLITTGSQTFAGNKTFSATPSFNAGIIASNTGGNIYIPSSGAEQNSTNSPYLIGGASSTTLRITLAGGTSSSAFGTANASYSGVIIGSNTFNTSSTASAHPIVASFAVKPVIGTVNTGTITNSATVYIEGPSALTATNVYSLWVDAGAVRLDTLGGSGTRMVVADATGVLSTQAIPGGGSAYSVTSVSTTYSETATSGTKIIKATTAGGTFVITLPTAVGNTATIIIKKIAGTAVLTIDGDGTETIDGGLTASMNKVDESITLVSDNSNWLII